MNIRTRSVALGIWVLLDLACAVTALFARRPKEKSPPKRAQNHNQRCHPLAIAH
ncbi:hypothetical protein LMG28138_05572 [Pararobbsia alpina]|uniref:Uncharacterized protein n=1 Tax=Pararobbsia alpina TaxID=621374 RepID=A0A6S7C058_9BURK|nr:hypothetical protein LMG28138_05572 [Pararobbsia alpina]